MPSHSGGCKPPPHLARSAPSRCCCVAPSSSRSDGHPPRLPALAAAHHHRSVAGRARPSPSPSPFKPGLGAAGPIAGMLADRYGAWKVLIGGGLLYALGWC